MKKNLFLFEVFRPRGATVSIFMVSSRLEHTQTNTKALTHSHIHTSMKRNQLWTRKAVSYLHRTYENQLSFYQPKTKMCIQQMNLLLHPVIFIDWMYLWSLGSGKPGVVYGSVCVCAFAGIGVGIFWKAKNGSFIKGGSYIWGLLNPCL